MKTVKKLTNGVGGGNLSIYFLAVLLVFACSKAQLPTSETDLDGELVIIVNQDSALVTIKNEDKQIVARSKERYASYMLPPGEYQISGEKAGCEPVETPAVVFSQQETVVHLQLWSQKAPPPNLTFTVLQDSVEYGEAVMIQWQSDGYQVIIDQGVGSRGPVGSDEVLFVNPGKKIFTATAYSEQDVLTIERDSTYVKEAPMPLLPVLMLSATNRVTVNTPVNISWLSQNADYVVVDFIKNAGLQGSEEVIFSTPGVRIVTATAFNHAGYVSVSDTVEVVEPNVVSVDDIILAADASVRADKGESGATERAAATFNVLASGKYQIVTEVWYNSGDDQTNESFYLTLRNSSNSTLFPTDSNAGLYKVISDDPGTPHTMARESGIFKLSEGQHSIDISHYVKIATQYPNFLNGPIQGPESVKILGFRLVYMGD